MSEHLSTRLLAVNAFDADVPLLPVPAERRQSGSPTDGATAWAAIGEVEVGIWEMTAGSATDTEVNEVFVVLHGSAEVAFDDGEVIDLCPGCVVRLSAGERTLWTVHETLRKVYVAG